MKKTFYTYVLLSLVSGLAIAWMDSQPNWDDTGITVFCILVASAFFGFLSVRKAWLIALATSIWIPVWAVVSTHNYGAFLALLPGFAGAYMGHFIKRTISTH